MTTLKELDLAKSRLKQEVAVAVGDFINDIGGVPESIDLRVHTLRIDSCGVDTPTSSFAGVEVRLTL